MNRPSPARPYQRYLKGGCLCTLPALVVLVVVAVVAFRSLCLTLLESPPAATQQKQEAALAQRLRHDVEQLCAHPRYGSEQDRSRATDYIAQRLEDAGWQVRRATFTVPADPEAAASAKETHHNIIATAPQHSSSRAAASAKRYIIGAHYDACDTGGTNPGADDNASACAALLALADMLSPRKTDSRKPGTPALELVFYDCEEPPWFATEWMGSAAHARHCRPTDTLGMICLEMLGYYSDSPCALPEPFPCHQLLLPEKGDFIAVVGDSNSRPLARLAQEYLQRGMPALRVNLPFMQDTELFFSDHRNYAARGIPSIMVTDTAMLRNPNYHEATDTPNTLDYPRLARVTLNLARFLRTLTREPSLSARKQK